MRSYWCGVALFFICSHVGTIYAEAPETPRVARSSPLTVEQAVTEAVNNNLNLLAERVNLSIADASVITAHLRPNPVVSLSADHQDFLGTDFSRRNGAGPPEISVRVDVPMERGNKRAYRIETATYGHEVAEARLLEATRRLTLDVALACIDVLEAKADMRLAQDNLQMLQEIVRLNTVKVKDGGLAPVELTRSHVAMMQYQGNVKRAELALATAKTKVQNLLGRSTDGESLDIKGELGTSLRNREISVPLLQEQAFTHRADLQALARTQARSQADLKLQLAQAKIDYTWGVEYRRQQGVNAMGDTVGVFLSVPLPLFNRNQGEIARVEAENEQIARQVQALRAQIQAEIQAMAKEFEITHDLVESIERDLLHPATQARETIAYTYRAGASSLVEFLDAQRAFNETMQSYYEAQANYRRAVMKLNATLGMEVTAS